MSECIRYWVSNCDKVHMGIGSLVGPNIFVKICGWSTAQISRELKVQLEEEFGEIPNKLKLINCVGGGSSAYGFWSEFFDYDKKQIELIGVEAGGPKKSKLHAAPLSNNSKNCNSSWSCCLFVYKTQMVKLMKLNLFKRTRLPSVSPIHCF